MVTMMYNVHEISWIHWLSKSRQRWKTCVSWELIPFWYNSTRQISFPTVTRVTITHRSILLLTSKNSLWVINPRSVYFIFITWIHEEHILAVSKIFNLGSLLQFEMTVHVVADCNCLEDVIITGANTTLSVNLFWATLLPERMQSESRDLENPSAVHVTVSTRQVTVWLENRLVQVNHSLASTKYYNKGLQRVPTKKGTGTSPVILPSLTQWPVFAKFTTYHWCC